MTRSKINYRIKKARKRLSEPLDKHEQLEIIQVTYWAARGDARIDDRLNAVAKIRGAK